MQLLDLRPFPSLNFGKTRYVDDRWRFQSFCGVNIYEEANVLQHENQDNIEKYIKHNEDFKNLQEA